MPDIQLRFNRDMLVLSTPIDYQLKAQGFDQPSDREYVALLEPELIEECYKLEDVLQTPCFVTATEGITDARLAHARFEGRAAEMAQVAFETAVDFTPQHIIAAVGPSGLPLDPSSAPSLKQSKQQYQTAVSSLAEYPFDAIMFSAFSNPADAQCALMGARAVYDGPLMISLAPADDGSFADGRTLGEVATMCAEYGADVVGVTSSAPPAMLEALARMVVEAVPGPVLVEIEVRSPDKRQFEPTVENPYPTPDDVVNLAVNLHKAGVQFLRATGAATPSYTGALLVAVMGHDVVVA